MFNHKINNELKNVDIFYTILITNKLERKTVYLIAVDLYLIIIAHENVCILFKIRYDILYTKIFDVLGFKK